MKQQAGFTLIELIMVIVILGILAATALPKFVDLSTDAKQAALKGVAGAITSGGSINFGLRSLHAASGTQVTAAACTTALVQSMVEATTVLTTGYTVGGTAPTCTINYNPAVTGISAENVNIPLIN